MQDHLVAAAAVVTAATAVGRLLLWPLYRAASVIEKAGRAFASNEHGDSKFDQLCDDVAAVAAAMRSHIDNDHRLLDTEIADIRAIAEAANRRARSARTAPVRPAV